MKLFLSYRRADSQATAVRMAQFLEQVPAVKELFLDVADIDPGEDFEQRIRGTLAAASHVFVLIGNAWLGPSAGRPRIFDDADLVRLELQLALRSGLRVVPVLIDDARMPSAQQLPAELRALTTLNAFALRSTHFERDMDELLESLLGRKRRGSRWRGAKPGPLGIAARAGGGLAVGAVLLIGAGLLNRLLSDDCYDLVCRLKTSLGIGADADALGLLWLIVCVVLGVSMLLPFLPRWLARRR